jgi:prepilin-type N-terminal cleavage/methylation domain-containing protein
LLEIISMTALDHLRNILGCELSNEDCCHFCGEENYATGEIEKHAPDCPWVAAKAFLEHWDEQDRLNALNPCDPMSPGHLESIRVEILKAHFDRRAFTLIELLAVLVIIAIVSAVALPTVLSALSHRQVSEGARVLQAQLAGARDAAIRDNAPSGIRLLPDPGFTGINPVTGLFDPTMPVAYNRMVPLSQAPNYSEGIILPWQGPGLPAAVAALPYPGPGTPTIPNPTYANTTALMVYENAFTQNLPNPPTSWFWNIRVGDKIQLNNAGPWYTIIGPMVIWPGGAGVNRGNSELFVNVGQPGTASPFLDANSNPLDFLLLVNGRTDGGGNWVDPGWDGVDNDGVNGVDDIGEWVNVEAWLGSLGSG